MCKYQNVYFSGEKSCIYGRFETQKEAIKFAEKNLYLDPLNQGWDRVITVVIKTGQEICYIQKESPCTCC